MEFLMFLIGGGIAATFILVPSVRLPIFETVVLIGKLTLLIITLSVALLLASVPPG